MYLRLGRDRYFQGDSQDYVNLSKRPLADAIDMVWIAWIKRVISGG